MADVVQYIALGTGHLKSNSLWHLQLVLSQHHLMSYFNQLHHCYFNTVNIIILYSYAQQQFVCSVFDLCEYIFLSSYVIIFMVSLVCYIFICFSNTNQRKICSQCNQEPKVGFSNDQKISHNICAQQSSYSSTLIVKNTCKFHRMEI